jgi:molybdopterin-containing oxidoreductase family membrane subunit
MFYPTKFDVAILIGSFGLFFTCFLLFIRFLPMIAMWEVKGVSGHGAHKAGLSNDQHAHEHDLDGKTGKAGEEVLHA